MNTEALPTDQTVPIPHGVIRVGDLVLEHLYGPYMVESRTTKRRVCLVPRCGTVERLDVSKS